MAICKILHINDATGAKSHLSTVIEYIQSGEKTEEKILTGGYNLQPEYAMKQMMETKESFGKTGGRQAYHVIISFKEGETDADTAMAITKAFVEEYLADYEALYAVHVNTDHIHSHIIFNSVSFVTGRKYHYKKNDWATYIQPVINRLCEEHGLSIIEIDPNEEHTRYQEWNEHRDGPFVWSDMIKRDIDIAIAEAEDFDDFINIMKSRGYIDKQNKYLAFKAPGMSRFRRTRFLGDDYTEERIRERILVESIASYKTETLEEAERIVYSKIPRKKKALLSPIQKKYYARLFRLGLIMRRPYSKAWQYKDEIKKFHKLQEQYLFLVDHDISSEKEMETIKATLDSEKNKSVSEKNRNYRTGKKCRKLFEIVHEMEGLKPAVILFQKGDMEFQHEYERWLECEDELTKQGYSYEEVKKIELHYKSEGKRLRKVVSDISKEQKLLKDIIAECERMRDISYDEKIVKERIIEERDNEAKKDNRDKENNEKRWQPNKI